jgi:hypothetical protein
MPFKEVGWVGLEPTTNALKGRRFRFTTSWLLSSYDHANFGCSICCSAGLSLLFLFRAVLGKTLSLHRGSKLFLLVRETRSLWLA